MITFINESNSEKYHVLFDKASAALAKKEGVSQDQLPIETLEQYFFHIKSLSELDKKYIVLPLDEEVFEINANTRQITVPPTFKKHGIGVQGDQVAEIVYFKIDRFFDAMDLNNTEIYIQWETAPDSKGIVNRGASREFVRDIESEYGKLIFGWPISSSITQNPGNIKFSVRFLERAEDNKDIITYNFGTLTASVLINPGQNFELIEGGIEVEDLSQMILNRIEGSTVAGDNIEVAEPIITLQLADEADLNADGKYLLKTQAWSPDSGNITYNFTKTVNGGSPEPIAANIVFELTNDDTAQPQTSYYKEVERGVYQAFDWAAETDISRENVYEKFGTAEVDSVGAYNAFAVNNKGYATKEGSAGILVVPTAVSPTIDVDGNLPTSLIFEEENGIITPQVLQIKATAKYPEKETLTYSWFNGLNELEGKISSRVEINEEGIYFVKVASNRNKTTASINSNKCRITKHAAEPIIIEIEGNPVVGNELSVSLSEIPSDGYKYQWYKYTAAEDDNDTIIENANQVTFTPTAAGTYYVVVTNTRNGTEASKTSDKIVVSD